LNLYIEEATTRKEKMTQATLSDSSYSDAKSLLEWDDERAAEFAADKKKKKKKKKRNLIYSYAN
jgi:TfoX/Sxy family transcriptional regulator of competence genes